MWPIINFTAFILFILFLRHEYRKEVKEYKAKHGITRRDAITMKYRMMGRKPQFWEMVQDWFWVIDK